MRRRGGRVLASLLSGLATLIDQEDPPGVDTSPMEWVALALAIVSVALLIRGRSRSNGDDAQYRAIVDGAPFGVVVFDGDKVLYANQQVVGFVGFDGPVGVIGRTFEEILAPETAEIARAGYNEIVATQQPVKVKDFPVTGRNGSTVRCDLRFVPVEFNGQQAVEGAFTPVDEMHEVELALRETEERFRRFFEDMPVPMYRTRVDGTIVHANKALAAMLGIADPAELTGVNAADFYADDGERQRLAALQREQGLLEDQISLLIGINGNRIWVRDSSHTIDDGDGQIFEGALVDVTEGQQATRELVLRARQQQALAHVGEAALRSTDAGEFLDEAVEQVCEVVGAEGAVLAREHEGGGLLVTSAAYATDSIRRREHVLAYLQDHVGLAAEPGSVVQLPPESGGDNDQLEGIAVRIAGSSAPYGVLAVCGSDLDLAGDGRTFLAAVATMLGSAIDRTRARARLERLMRSKDEFVASVSHELRTPLTVVAGLALELDSGWRGFSADEVAEFISLIADQSREMSDLIEDLLVAARADIGKVPIHPEAANLRVSIDQVVAVCSLADRARIKVVGDNVFGKVDPVRFRQIVRNLITNAIRYGGPRIEIRVKAREGQAVVSVFDDGIGIPEAERERVFMAYERAHAAGGVPSSVGLGLTVSQQLTEMMGGEISYRYEGGSIFTATFVAASAPAPQVTPSNDAGDGAAPGDAGESP